MIRDGGYNDNNSGPRGWKVTGAQVFLCLDEA